MKKLIAFLGIAALFMALRFYDNGLLSIGQSGRLTVFSANGVETVYDAENRPFLYRLNNYHRLDVYGNADTAKAGLKDLSAKIIKTEKIDNLEIIYAYSPYVNFYETVANEKINVMVAVGGGKVVYGSPLIKGSY